MTACDRLPRPPCSVVLKRSAAFDNAKTAVTRVLRGRNREENEAFSAFRDALALHVEFAAPAKGNEKGGVEGVDGFIEDNFFRRRQQSWMHGGCRSLPRFQRRLSI